MYIAPYANGALTSTAVLAVNLSKGGTATLQAIFFGNEANSAPSYLQIWDVATAAVVTVGTTPPNMIIDAPALLGNSLDFTLGVLFKNGVVIAATTTATGSTAPSSNCTVTLAFH